MKKAARIVFGLLAVTVFCTGAAGYAQVPPPGGSGTVFSWGGNWRGQLGDGTTEFRSTPLAVPGLPAVKAIATPMDSSLALLANGEVMQWGYNNECSGPFCGGQGTIHLTPVGVPGLAGIQKLGVGWFHSFAIDGFGDLWAWGNNGAGQLGDGTSEFRDTPVRLNLPFPVLEAAGGMDHSVALLADGRIMTWGANDKGQLGDGGAMTSSAVPIAAELVPNVRSVSAGVFHSIALTQEGLVYTWGNEGCQMGQTGCSSQPHPLPVPDPFDHAAPFTGVSAVVGGGWHTVALRADGTVWTWGGNSMGQLGIGSQDSDAHPYPVQVSDPSDSSGYLTGVVAIAAKCFRSVALKADGTVVTWGFTAGVFQTFPAPVPDLNGIAAIASGMDHTLALKGDCIDADGDGYSDAACGGADCNDQDMTIHPGAPEVCNGVDENCDGQIDEGVLATFYDDSDGDGYGDPNRGVGACFSPVGFVDDRRDNCPLVKNSDLTDSDGDGIGDVCDSCPLDPGNDADGDGLCGDVDNCPNLGNPDQADIDHDGSGDACDNCRITANPDQQDSNGNGLGDACPPIARDDSFEIAEDGVLTVPAPGILANDFLENGFTPTWISVVAGSTFGKLSAPGTNGAFTYEPPLNFSGTVSFQYQTFFTSDDSAPATVTITVTPVNDPPVLAPVGPRSVRETEVLSFSISATDVETATADLTFFAADLPAGAVFDPASRTFSWQPTRAQSGNYAVTFGVRDEGGATDTETVTITVVDVPFYVEKISNDSGELGIDENANVVWSTIPGFGGQYRLYRYDSAGGATEEISSFAPAGTNHTIPRMNARGDVTWAYGDAQGRYIYLYDRENGNSRPLSTSGEAYGFSEINDRGQAVWGESVLSSEYHLSWQQTFLFDGTQSRQITDAFVGTYGAHINNRGQVAWIQGNEAGIYLWENGQGRKISEGTLYHGAPIINDRGDVLWSGSGPGIASQLYLYNGETVTTAPFTTAAVNLGTYLMNNQGDIVWNEGSNGAKEIYLYRKSTGTTTRITNDTFEDSLSDLNDHGDIVWQRRKYIYGSEPFNVYHYEAATGEICEVSTFLPQDGYNGYSQPMINNAGVIAFRGGWQRGIYRAVKFKDSVPRTEPGLQITVSPTDESTGRAHAITFTEVNSPGFTSIHRVEALEPAPSGFLMGSPPEVYEISTTAAYQGPVQVCLNYEGAGFSGEAGLRLFHMEHGAWVDRTDAGYPDMVNKIVCGTVEHFSVFALLAPENNPPTAAAGSDIVAECTSAGGAFVTLDGSGSSDPDGDPLVYTWTWEGGSASGANPTVQFSLGEHSITLIVDDGKGGRSTDTVKVTVLYRFGGFLPPVSLDKPLKLGSTVPVKFLLSYEGGTSASGATARLTLQKLSNDQPVGEPIAAESTTGADTGDWFRYDAADNLYIFNLSTRVLSQGNWRITVSLDDGTLHTVTVALKN